MPNAPGRVPLTESHTRALLFALYQLTGGDLAAAFPLAQVAGEAGLAQDLAAIAVRNAKKKNWVVVKGRLEVFRPRSASEPPGPAGEARPIRQRDYLVALTDIGLSEVYQLQKPWYLRTWKSTLATIVAGGLLGWLLSALSLIVVALVKRLLGP